MSIYPSQLFVFDFKYSIDMWGLEAVSAQVFDRGRHGSGVVNIRT